MSIFDKIINKDPSVTADIKLEVMKDLEFDYTMNEVSKNMVIEIQPDYDNNPDEDIKIFCNSTDSANVTAEIIEDADITVDDVIRNVIYITGINTVSNQSEQMRLEKYLKKQVYKIYKETRV